MDLSLLSPEAQDVLMSGRLDQIEHHASLVKGRDTNTYEVMHAVARAMREWTEFDAEHLKDGIAVLQQIAEETYHKELTRQRAAELLQLIHIFQSAFGTDPDQFFQWLMVRQLRGRRA
jgi:hypothetical protein